MLIACPGPLEVGAMADAFGSSDQTENQAKRWKLWALFFVWSAAENVIYATLCFIRVGGLL